MKIKVDQQAEIERLAGLPEVDIGRYFVLLLTMDAKQISNKDVIINSLLPKNLVKRIDDNHIKILNSYIKDPVKHSFVPKELTDKLMEEYRILKGGKNDPNWHTVYYMANKGNAEKLLLFFSLNLETAIRCLKQLGNNFDNKGFCDWSLNAIVKNAMNFKKYDKPVGEKSLTQINDEKRNKEAEVLLKQANAEKEACLDKYKTLPEDERRRVHNQATINAYGISRIYGSSEIGVECEIVKIMKSRE